MAAVRVDYRQGREPPLPHPHTSYQDNGSAGYCALAKWLSYKYHHSDNTTLNRTTLMTHNQGQKEKTKQRTLSKIGNCIVVNFTIIVHCTYIQSHWLQQPKTTTFNIFVTVSQYKIIRREVATSSCVSSLDCELWFYYGVSSQPQHQPNVWRVQISSRGIFSHSAHLSRLSALQIIIFSKHDSGSTQQNRVIRSCLVWCLDISIWMCVVLGSSGSGTGNEFSRNIFLVSTWL